MESSSKKNPIAASISWSHFRDLNYIIFKIHQWELLLPTRSDMKHSILNKSIRFFAKLIINILYDLINCRKIQFNIHSKFVFLGHSSSSKEVLGPLVVRYGQDAIFIETVEKFNKQGKRLPQSVVYLLSILMLPIFLYHLFIMSTLERRSSFWFLPTILMSYGTDIYWKVVLTFNKPIAIFVANDHSFETRSPVLAARKKGIPVFYIQHAPVTKLFPPLVFDIAFLEGENALQCYNVKESNQVILVGNIKFEMVRHLRNKKTTVNVIGIAGSSFLTKATFHHLVEIISYTFKELKIIFRPHPDGVHKDWSIPKSIEFSDVRIENSFTFLARIDLVIGGESGILAEAALMNVYPIMYGKENSNVTAIDSYGFIENNVCDLAKNEKDLLEIIRQTIKKKENSVDRVSYYYSNTVKPFGSDPYGRIIEIVNNYLRNN